MNDSTLIENSLDVMQILRDELGESVGLAKLCDDALETVILARAEGQGGVSVRFEVNYRSPLHPAAPAKAILANLPIEQCREIVGRMEFTRFTENTICSAEDFLRELQTVRQKGYAVDVAEHNAGCHCVGAAIMNGDGCPVAGIWVSSFANRMPVSDFDKVSRPVIEAARRISARLRGDDWQRDAFARAVIEDAERYLADNLTANVDFEEYAQSRRLSYSWFRSHFKQFTRESPKQYHLRLRMEEAKRLLTNTDSSIKEVAARLGYDNQDYFSAIFKRKEGVSPSDFRQTL